MPPNIKDTKSTTAALHDLFILRIVYQVIKALLTLMTTSSVELHDTALLSAVQASYHIHLTSRNAVRIFFIDNQDWRAPF